MISYSDHMGTFFLTPPNLVIGPFFGIFFKIDQTKQFQWSIMYSKVNQRLLNTFLILFSHFIHFLALQLTKKRKSWQNLPFLLFLALLTPLQQYGPLTYFGVIFQSCSSCPQMKPFYQVDFENGSTAKTKRRRGVPYHVSKN